MYMQVNQNNNPLLTIIVVALSIYFLRMTKSSIASALDNQVIVSLIIFIVSQISMKDPVKAFIATLILTFAIEGMKPPAQPVKVETMESMADLENLALDQVADLRIRGRNLLDKALERFGENKKYQTICSETTDIEGQNDPTYYELMSDVNDEDDDISPETLAQIVSNVTEIKEAIDVVKRETTEAVKEAAKEATKEAVQVVAEVAKQAVQEAKEAVQEAKEAVQEAKKDIVTEVLINNANNQQAVKEAVKEVLQKSSCSSNSYDPEELTGYDPLFYGASL